MEIFIEIIHSNIIKQNVNKNEKHGRIRINKSHSNT